MADGKAEAGALARRFCREEWIEHLLLHIRRNTGAVVPNSDFDAIAQTPRRGSERWLIAVATGLRLALSCRIEAVRDQIQKSPRDVLRKDLSLAGSRIKRPLDRDAEALLLGSRTVPGEIQTFFDQDVDLDPPVLARGLARVQQHVPDDRIGTLAMMHDLVEVIPQRMRQLIDLSARFI